MCVCVVGGGAWVWWLKKSYGTTRCRIPPCLQIHVELARACARSYVFSLSLCLCLPARALWLSQLTRTPDCVCVHALERVHLPALHARTIPHNHTHTPAHTHTHTPFRSGFSGVRTCASCACASCPGSSLRFPFLHAFPDTMIWVVWAVWG